MNRFLTAFFVFVLVVTSISTSFAQKKTAARPAVKAKPAPPIEFSTAAIAIQNVLPELGDNRKYLGSDERSILESCMEAMRYLHTSVACDHEPIKMPVIKHSKAKHGLDHLTPAIDALEAVKASLGDKSKSFCNERNDAIRTVAACEQWLKNVRSAASGK